MRIAANPRKRGWNPARPERKIARDHSANRGSATGVRSQAEISGSCEHNAALSSNYSARRQPLGDIHAGLGSIFATATATIRTTFFLHSFICLAPTVYHYDLKTGAAPSGRKSMPASIPDIRK